MENQAPNSPMPWHEQQWQQVDSYKDKLPHALLLTGIAGLGKRQFSHKLAQQVLCRDNLRHTDTNCVSCRLIESGTNPDLLIIDPAVGKQILIEEIHEVRNFLQMTSHLGKNKVVVINAADQMNPSSANALLKILEEPPAGKHLILTSSVRSMLLPTILSRCIKINFAVPELDAIQQWLKQELASQGNTPADLQVDDLLLAVSGFSPVAILDMLQSGKADLLHKFNQELDNPNGLHSAKLSAYKDLELMEILDLLLWRTEKQISHFAADDSQDEMQDESKPANLSALFALRSLLLDRRSMLLRKLNLNRELLLEECLLSISNVSLAPLN